MKTYSLISLKVKHVAHRVERETKDGKPYTQIQERDLLVAGKPIVIGKGAMLSITAYQGKNSQDKAIYNGVFRDFYKFNGVDMVALNMGDLVKVIEYSNILKFTVINGTAIQVQLNSLPRNMPEYKAMGSNPVRGKYLPDSKRVIGDMGSSDRKVNKNMINRGGISFDDKRITENAALNLVNEKVKREIQEKQDRDRQAAKDLAEKQRREAQAHHDKTICDAHCRLRKTLINACKVKKAA